MFGYFLFANNYGCFELEPFICLISVMVNCSEKYSFTDADSIN